MGKLRTEFFIETSEIYILKRKRFLSRAWCEQCGRKVNMIPPVEAAFLFGEDPNTINSLIAEKRIHLCFIREENPLLCLRSLCLI